MDESTVEGEGGVVALKSKYRVTVKVQTLVKESKKFFLAWKQSTYVIHHLSHT
jgi:hypothetical protein